MRPATQSERMKAAGRLQVLLWLSAESKQRLERLAVAHDLTQVGVVEAALLAFEAVPHEQRPAGGETSAQIDMAMRSVIDRVEALEKALAALKEQVASLYRPEPEAAEIGSCVAVGHDPSLDDVGTPESATVISEMKEEPEEPDGMENEAVPIPSIPSKPIDQPLPPIESAIKELGRQGYRQQAIAHELNRRGYRTANGTLIQRGYVGNRLKSLGL